MGNNGIDISDFSEFTQKLIRTAQTTYPKQARKFMNDEAKKCVKHVKKHAKGKVGKKRGNYLKGFKAGKRIYEYDGDDLNVLVYNSSPHAHLIEEGHRTANGGYVPGKHILQTAATTFESAFVSDVENELINYVIKGIEG